MQGHIYRKKSPDGSWSRWYAVIDHPGVDGKRRQKTSTHETKRDAQAWLAQVVAELRAGQVYDTTVTVQEYLSSWLAGKQSLRPSTRLSYRCHLHQYLIPYLGHHRLSALRAHHLEAMYAAITSGNNQRERPVGPERCAGSTPQPSPRSTPRSSVGCCGATQRQPSSWRECSDPGERRGMSAMRQRS